MTIQFIIDTNILIYFLDGSLTPNGYHFVRKAFNNSQTGISIISKIEILGFAFPNVASEINATELIDNQLQFPLNDDIVNKTIDIRKNNKIKVADGIIAATAIQKKITLVTRNEKDFKNLPGLNIINPFSL